MVTPDKRKTSPVVAAVLSVLLVGLGQMLNGQLAKGLVMLVAALVIGAITGGIVAPIVWAISAIDAYRCCKKLESGMSIAAFSFF